PTTRRGVSMASWAMEELFSMTIPPVRFPWASSSPTRQRVRTGWMTKMAAMQAALMARATSWSLRAPERPVLMARFCWVISRQLLFTDHEVAQGDQWSGEDEHPDQIAAEFHGRHVAVLQDVPGGVKVAEIREEQRDHVDDLDGEALQQEEEAVE